MTRLTEVIKSTLVEAIIIKRRDELLQGVTQIFNLDDMLIVIIKPNGSVEIIEKIEREG